MVRQSLRSLHTNAVWWMVVVVWKYDGAAVAYCIPISSMPGIYIEPIAQVRLRALRMFFGVGTLHPKYIIHSKISAIIGLASLADARRSAITIIYTRNAQWANPCLKEICVFVLFV